MWFFLKRRKEVKADPPQHQGEPDTPRRQVLSFDELASGMGDFSDLAVEDTALKFWLPEPMERALEELAKYYQVSLSMLVRMLLVEYVYGRYASVYMRENLLGIYRPRYADTIRYSVRSLPPGARKVYNMVYKVPELGKNIAPIKVYLPRRLKEDLTALASHADVLPSRFVRELLIGAVLGRGTLPERSELRAAPHTPSGDLWEQGGTVPMRVAEFGELGELTDYEVETVYDEEDVTEAG